MVTRNNVTFVVGLCALCFALGEHASAGHATKQDAEKLVFVEYQNKDKSPNLDAAVLDINTHSLRIVTAFDRAGTTAGFVCTPIKP